MAVTTFGQLEIGQHFGLGIDADGTEPYFYKLDDATAYQYSGNHAGGWETFEADDEVYPFGEKTVLHTHVTEVERAALTLIFETSVEHRGLAFWIAALCDDPTERRSLDEYIWQAEIDGTAILDLCNDAGYVVWRKPYDRDHSAFGAILDHKAMGTRPENEEERFFARISEAVLRLADAIVEYRVAGRPEGDQTFHIVGMGGPIGTVATSLAAAIVEFHKHVLDAFCDRR